MMQYFSALKLSTIVMGSIIAFNVYGDTIYCADNKQMRCLGFGEKVVNSNAVCFEPLKCSQEGFVCKSELDSLADEHESLLGKHNELVSTHNELISVYENTVSEYEKLERCVNTASTLDEAKGCI